MNPASHDQMRSVFRDHERFLWGLCYRMTGSAADAEDLVQDTFVRAMESPPTRTDEPWKPWLVRVAINLGRDHLRRRRRRRYTGPWLPAPVPLEAEESPPSHEPILDGDRTTEGRYDLMESVSYAFLLALEALTPAQRAVILLRDVFDYSVRETGVALGMTEPNVKTTHHRARRAMRDYDRHRCPPTRELRARHRDALERLVSSLAARDAAGLEALLAEDVTAYSDGGGVYHAALRPILGRDRVVRFLLALARRRAVREIRPLSLNGVPALLVELDDDRPHEAWRFVLRCELDLTGHVREVHSVLNPDKLSAVA